jgi:hypothetical protein
MTAISAIISNDGIAVASDSLLTKYDPKTGQTTHIEFKKSKIVPIRRFTGALSYWGLAEVGLWKTYDFLKEKASNANGFNSFEDFANNLKDTLNLKLNSFSIQNPLHKGIGIHLVGYEEIGDLKVPELFLISNYLGTDYLSVGDMAISRNLYFQLPDHYKLNNPTFGEQRDQIKKFLVNYGWFMLNNGDPILYNQAANAIQNMFIEAIRRSSLKRDEKAIIRLASKPIEMVKEMQKDFFKKDTIRVGGKIHRLFITERGDFISDTGDNKF